MMYRVIRTKDGQTWTFDFDDKEDARDWVVQEIGFDENCANPQIFTYSIIEVDYEAC